MRLITAALAGLLLGIGPFTAVAQAQSSALNYLHIRTAEGKDLKAPVKSFRGLSLGVITTLVKQGKMTRSSEKGTNPPGQMMFSLDKNLDSDFFNWVMSPDSLASGSSTGGRFQWVDPKGKISETFTMTGIRVVSYVPNSGNDNGGGTLILVADQTVADPPINFDPIHK